MISPSEDNAGAPAAPATTGNKVKAMPSSPIYAVFDIVDVDGKQIVVGEIAFVDQFGMERLAKTGTDLGVLNLGKHVLAIFQGQVDIMEPDEATKEKLAANLQQEALEAKGKILNAYAEASKKASSTSSSDGGTAQ